MKSKKLIGLKRWTSTAMFWHLTYTNTYFS